MEGVVATSTGGSYDVGMTGGGGGCGLVFSEGAEMTNDICFPSSVIGFIYRI